jgi:hypothetical protein
MSLLEYPMFKTPTILAVLGACTLAALAAPASAEERVCRESLGAITVDNLRVPSDATCTLNGTSVKGTIKVESNATLNARGIAIVGNVQSEYARQVNVLEGSRVGGSVQVKQGGGATVNDSFVTGDIQYESNATQLRALRNEVGGSIQAFQNIGGVELRNNVIDGNLQCKENWPAPVGGENIVGGNAEDQCARLEGGGTGGGVGLKSLTLRSSEIAGCRSVTGMVTLSGPAPAGGVTVVLGDNLAAASTPDSLRIAEGATSRTFAVKTIPVAASQSGNVNATLGGMTLRQNLKVRPMGLASLALSPTTVIGSQTVTGTAKLECTAGPGPVTVDLASSNGAVAYPIASSIVVPQGLQSASFDVATAVVKSRTSATISATANGIGKSRSLTVSPAAVVAPAGLSFGGHPVGSTSGTLNATLTNKGAVAYSVGSIGITGTYAAWFTQSNNCPSMLASGASCTIGVKFKPTAVASRSARLSITTSATSTPLSVTLSGTGL